MGTQQSRREKRRNKPRPQGRLANIWHGAVNVVCYCIYSNEVIDSSPEQEVEFEQSQSDSTKEASEKRKCLLWSTKTSKGAVLTKIERTSYSELFALNSWPIIEHMCVSFHDFPDPHRTAAKMFRSPYTNNVNRFGQAFGATLVRCPPLTLEMICRDEDTFYSDDGTTVYERRLMLARGDEDMSPPRTNSTSSLYCNENSFLKHCMESCPN